MHRVTYSNAIKEFDRALWCRPDTPQKQFRQAIERRLPQYQDEFAEMSSADWWDLWLLSDHNPELVTAAMVESLW